MLDIEYYINKTAHAIQREAGDAEVQRMLRADGLTQEEIFLVIQAGAILAGDWAFYEADELPTKPDIKTVRRLTKTK